MATDDFKEIKKDLVEINTFVRDRFDPVTRDVDLLRGETERLNRDISEMQHRERALRRDALIQQAQQDPSLAVLEGPYAGMDMLDLALIRRFAYSQRRESFGPAWLDRAEDAKRRIMASITPATIQASHQAATRRLEAWYTVDHKSTGQFEGFSRSMLQLLTRAAMDSTTAGSGDELVATLEARELWMDVNLQTLVAPLVPTFPMPSNPFDVPRQLGDVIFYPGTENVSATSTALTTGKTTLTAYELVGQVPYSFTLEEDAVIALLPEIRAKLGKYGARPSQLAWVMDVNTFIRAQSVSQFRTMDKLGPNATILTGMLGAIEGIPVIVSEQMKLADTDGKVTDAGNGTDTGRLLIFNRTQWAQGFRRELIIDVDRDTQKRQTVVTVSFRHALTERSGTRSSATHTALQYDVTGVA